MEHALRRWWSFIPNNLLVLLLQMCRIIHFLRPGVLLLGKDLPDSKCLKKQIKGNDELDKACTAVVLFCSEKHTSKVDIYFSESDVYLAISAGV